VGEPEVEQRQLTDYDDALGINADTDVVADADGTVA
jgi:hypothetical protein